MDRSNGLEMLGKVLESVRLSIEEQNGTFKVAHVPRLVSDSDEADLRRQMAELEEANREVSGDEDDDEEDENDEEDDEGEDEEDDQMNGH